MNDLSARTGDAQAQTAIPILTEQSERSDDHANSLTRRMTGPLQTPASSDQLQPPKIMQMQHTLYLPLRIHYHQRCNFALL